MPLKIIPSTARERKRYLLVKIESSDTIDRRDIENAILNSCLQFLGELGVARAGIIVMSDTYNGKTVVVKTGHKFIDETKSAISLIKSIGNKKVRLSTVKVSGAIKNLK